MRIEPSTIANFLAPAAKRIGKDLTVQEASELIFISIDNIKPKKSLKNTVESQSKAS